MATWLSPVLDARQVWLDAGHSCGPPGVPVGDGNDVSSPGLLRGLGGSSVPGRPCCEDAPQRQVAARLWGGVERS